MRVNEYEIRVKACEMRVNEYEIRVKACEMRVKYMVKTYECLPSNVGGVAGKGAGAGM
jgi:hypothetical protein